jgi:YVTN family beta-propeller protein
MNRPWIRAAGLVALAVADLSVADTSGGYRISHRIALGVPDRWDYVVYDAPSQRVFVAHGDHVTVVDGRDGKVLGQVEGFPGGTHGTAIVPNGGPGFTDDGKAGTVGLFDPLTFKVQKSLKAETDADGITFDPASGQIFVIDGDSGKITVIDPKGGAVAGTVSVGSGLEAGVPDGRGSLYVDGAEANNLVRVNTTTLSVLAQWPLAGCTSPAGIAVDPVARRVFSSCRNGVMVVVDADTGRLVATVPIGKGTDSAAYDPKRHRIFSSNGQDGTISVIEQRDPEHYRALDPIATAVTGRTMAIDPDSGRLYVAAANVDARVPVEPGKRPTLVPGSLELLFIDPLP